MKVIEEGYKVGAVIGGNTIGCLYEGDNEDYMNFIEDIECDLDGETSASEERKIPHGEGSNFTIYSDDDPVYIYVNDISEYNDDGEYIEKIQFGKYV
jgi:hypothetical protein